MTPEPSIRQHLTDDPPTVVPLSIRPHFEALSDKQKLYAHHLSIACFSGFRILLRQVSPESEGIYDLIIALHSACGGDWKSLAQKQGVGDEDMRHFLNYAAQFLGNGGNYKSFGDSKFVPRVSAHGLEALAKCSFETLDLFRKCREGIYSLDGGRAMLGYPDAGHVSAYYPKSPSITKDEIAAISGAMEKRELLPENTHLSKIAPGRFKLLVASRQRDPRTEDRDISEKKIHLPGVEVRLVFGRDHVEMGKIADALTKARKYPANDTQAEMVAEYVKSFETGSMEAYKQSQRLWVKDKGPMVETDIGFIETYRDPHGIRGEWEGFVAMVNQERTKAFGRLVEAAPNMIPKLPWGKEFEKDEFLSPDFTSLEVLTFAGSGIPAGINIPNFDSIRQTYGFKNVSLNNVLSASAPHELIPFISADDLPVYSANRDAAFELQVGLHELLGHGCGKLLQETSTGVFNFPHSAPPINPLTSKPVNSWYKPGQTWSSLFGALAGPYEECRAELVAMALCVDPAVLSVFGFGIAASAPPDAALHGKAGDIVYASYLSMARAGIAALEFWDPKSRKWGQPHMQARFSILQTFLAAGRGFCRLEWSGGKDAAGDLYVKVERGAILSVGRPASERYLLELGVCKAVADVERGSTTFEEKTRVNAWWEEEVRPVVLEQKMPRKVFVQGNTVLEREKVRLRDYEASPEGIILSFADRGYI